MTFTKMFAKPWSMASASPPGQLFITLDEKSLEKIKSIVSGSQSMVHGNTGKRNVDEGREDAYQNIIDVLCGLEENESTPFAVRTVRDTSGRSSLRDQ